MAATVTQILQRENAIADVAFVLEIEGIDKLFSSYDDDTIRTSAWGGTYSSLHTGLQKPSSITRSMDLRRFSIEPVGIDFTIDDVDDSLATLFADNLSAAKTTKLTAALDRDDTTVTVDSTSLFPSSGTIYIGLERITYSGKTSTTFTGCTRGTFPWAGKASWAHTHKLSSSGVDLPPLVSDKPLYWKGRGVTLYIIAKDPETGTWVSKANSINFFSGYLLDIGSEEKVWTLPCDSVEKRFSTSILRDQYRGYVRHGFELRAATLVLEESSVGGSISPNQRRARLDIAAGHYTLQSLIAEINEQAIAAKGSAATQLKYDWAFSLQPSGGGFRVQVQIVTNGATAGDSLTFSLRSMGDPEASRIWNLLGAPYSTMVDAVIATAAVSTFQWYSDKTPVDTEFMNLDGTVTLEEVQGTHADASNELPASTYGGDIVVEVTGLTEEPILWVADLNPATNVLTRKRTLTIYGDSVSPIAAAAAIATSGRWQILYGENRRIEVKQAWLVLGQTVGTILLRLLQSTGTANYNSTDDDWPDNVGLGIPSTLIDAASIQAMSGRAGEAANQVLYVPEPTPASDIVQSYFQSLGFQLVWRDGKLRAVVPNTVAGQPSKWTLDQSVMYGRGRMESGADMIITGLVLKYNYDPIADEFQATAAYHNLPARYATDEDNVMEYEARGLYDQDGSKIGPWQQQVAAPLIAYFSRAIRRFTVAATRGILGLSLGDIVTLTDDELPDPQTGAYGIAARKAWCVGFTFEPASMEYTSITLLVPPVANGAALAPSAMLDYNRGDKGYDSGGPDLYVLAHEFSYSSEPKDVEHFLAGYRIRLVEIDPAVPASVLEWFREIASVDIATNRIRLTASLSSPSFDTTKRYYVEFTTHDDVGLEAQRASTYIGDDATGIIMTDPSYPVFSWGDGIPDVEADTPDGTKRYRYPDDDQAVDGSALSVHKLRSTAEAVNNLIAHVTNQQPISDFTLVGSPRQSNADNPLLGIWKFHCPPGVTTIEVTYWATSAGGTPDPQIVLTTSPAPPGWNGDEDEWLGLTFPSEKAQNTQSIGNVSPYAKKTATMNVLPDAAGRCYLTAHGIPGTSAGAVYPKLGAICASFAAVALP